MITSWKRFKGLEADAVVTIEKPAKTGDNAKANANRYVARSRAKHLLTVIEVPVGEVTERGRDLAGE